MISGEGLSTFTLPHLEVLRLSECYELTEAGLVELLQHCGPELKALGIDSTGITGEGLAGAELQFPKVSVIYNFLFRILIVISEKRRKAKGGGTF